ncbi:MAG: hypothetical protein ACI81I_000380 [Arcobacteraceae bacterium]|jgi:hypothetical protein
MKETSIKLDNTETKIKIEKLNLLKSIFNIIKNTAGQKYTSIPADTINAIEAIKLEESSEQIAWKLISRALVSTLVQLVIEKIQFLEIEDIETYDLDKQLNELLVNGNYQTSKKFFDKPHELPFLKDCTKIIIEFFRLFELEEYEVNNMMGRFNSYFILSLVDEYRTNSSIYKSYNDTFNTPFNEAEEKVLEWFRYREWLEKQTEESIFGESFGLKQIYIPLHAYFQEKENKK